MVFKACAFKNNEVLSVLAHQMFCVYSVLAQISQIGFRQIFLCFLTVFLPFVHAQYYSTILFVDHLLIYKYNIFYLSCCQKSLETP